MRVVNTRPYALAVAALDLQPADRVLELGCGPGEGLRLAAARISPGGAIHGIDHSMAMLAQARARNRAAVRAGRICLCRCCFEELPFADRSIDKILAVNVAYFWRDPGVVLREARRVLRPGGTMSLYVTDAGTMRHWPFADRTTHRLFDRDELAQMLCRGGFAAGTFAITTVLLLPRVGGLVAVARSEPSMENNGDR